MTRPRNINTKGQTPDEVKKIVEERLYELAPGFCNYSYETMDMERYDAIVHDLYTYMFRNPEADLDYEIHDSLEDWFEDHEDGDENW